MVHRSAELNQNADFLSRNPVRVATIEEMQTEEESSMLWERPNLAGPHNFKGGPLPSQEELRKEQATDEFKAQVAERAEGVIFQKDGLWSIQDKLSRQVITVVPKSLTLRVLFFFHGTEVTGHLGTNKLLT